MVLFRVAEAMLGCVMQPVLCQHNLLMSNAGLLFDTVQFTLPVNGAGGLHDQTKGQLS